MHCICTLLVRARARSSYTDLQVRLVQASSQSSTACSGCGSCLCICTLPVPASEPFFTPTAFPALFRPFQVHCPGSRPGFARRLETSLARRLYRPSGLESFSDRLAGENHSARRHALGLSFFWGCPHFLWTSPGGRGWSHKILPRPSVLASKKQNHYGRAPQKLSPRPCSFSFCHPPRVEELLATGWEYTVASVAMGLGCPALCGPAASPGAGWAARLSAVLAFSM